MRTRDLLNGLLLILLGLLFLMQKLGLIMLYWKNLLDWWPLLLIYFGAMMLPVKFFLKAIIAAIIFAIAVYVLISPEASDEFVMIAISYFYI